MTGPKVTTTLRVTGEIATFVVVTENELYQDRIVHMGWRPAGDSTFTRRLAAPSDVQRIHANFARHLDEMILQSARLRPVGWDRALELFLERMAGTGLEWWLYGSAALAVRGLDVDPGDLDFAVTDARAVAEVFNDLLVEPVTHHPQWVAEWTGRGFHGALFEWLADPRADAGPHEQGPLWRSTPDVIEWRGHRVTVAPLELQLQSCIERGLEDRAKAILELIRM